LNLTSGLNTLIQICSWSRVNLNTPDPLTFKGHFDTPATCAVAFGLFTDCSGGLATEIITL